jgi:uncharacterized protein (TIGR02271 family)
MAEVNPSLRRLSEADDVEVAHDDPDVRGWDVRDLRGEEVGEVKDLIVDMATMKVRYLEVEPDGAGRDRRVLIPIDAAQLDAADEDVIVDIDRSALGSLQTFEAVRGGAASTWTNSTSRATETSGTQPARATPAEGSGSRRMTRSAEELRIGKREVAAGEVRVGKHVETERVRQPVTLDEERVVVERRPVSGEHMRADASIGEHGDISIPLTREEAVIEKRPVVKEEIVISKERVPRTETVETEVRREEFDVENTGGVPTAERSSGRARREEE